MEVVMMEVVMMEVVEVVVFMMTEDWSDQLWSGLVRPAYLLLWD